MSLDKTHPLDLAPCPFCGARGEVYQGSDQSNHWGMFKVQCATSDADNDEDYPEGCEVEPETAWYATEAEAVAAWNRRAALRSPRPSPADLREKIEGIVMERDLYPEDKAEQILALLAAPSLVSPPPDLRGRLMDAIAEYYNIGGKEIQAAADKILSLLGYLAPEGEPDGRGGMGKDGGA